MQKHCKLERQNTGEDPLQYLLHLPKNYEPSSQEQWPLILFLHGSGERGSDVDRVKLEGLPKEIEAGGEFPFIIVSPQCPEDSRWTNELDVLTRLLDEIQSSYHVDPSRMYLTGLSLGGHGTWHLAAKTPQTFAAIAPVCGRGEVQMAESLKNIPTWVFHGDQDDIVSIQHSIDMVKAIEKQGRGVRFTVYEGVGHDSWTETYRNPKLYEWFLEHTKG
ncbi:prolyl oligopeptidase family serine peptidase [Halobacillus rhizosphaerae]|uniref:carboxylesterase family protein n=1 Tax=Halobacillus rhizosphaerae TaxID=3064889 RepID=UPI00398A526A